MTDETTTLENRDEKIVDMLSAGTHTLKGIGDLFGVSKQRIRQIGERYGVTNQRNAVKREQARLLKEEKLELRAEEQGERDLLKTDVIQLREDGLTYKEIAEDVFCDESLWRRAQEICLAKKDSRHSKRDGNIYNLFLKGSDEDMLVEGTGLSLASIRGILKKEKKRAEERAAGV